MTKAVCIYNAWKREALAVIFRLKKLRVYLLSIELFTVGANHQVLYYAFRKKDFQRRLAKKLEFLLECLLSKMYNEWKLALIVGGEQSDLETKNHIRWLFVSCVYLFWDRFLRSQKSLQGSAKASCTRVTNIWRESLWTRNRGRKDETKNQSWEHCTTK